MQVWIELLVSQLRGWLVLQTYHRKSVRLILHEKEVNSMWFPPFLESKFSHEEQFVWEDNLQRVLDSPGNRTPFHTVKELRWNDWLNKRFHIIRFLRSERFISLEWPMGLKCDLIQTEEWGCAIIPTHYTHQDLELFYGNLRLLRRRHLGVWREQRRKHREMFP